MKRAAELLRRLVILGTRVFFYLVWLATSLYALLAHVPFTYRQVLQINLVPAINQFALLQPWLLSGSTLLVAASLFRIEKRRSLANEDRRELIGLVVLAFALSIWNLPRHLLLDGLNQAQENWHALAWSLAIPIAPLWLSLYDLRDLPRIKVTHVSSLQILASSLIAGLLSAAMFALLYQKTQSPAGSLAFFGILITSTALAVFAAAILSMVEQMIRSADLRLSKSIFVYGLALASALSFFCYNVVCSSIAFFGTGALAWSFIFALAACLAVVSLAVKRIGLQRNLVDGEISLAILAAGFSVFGSGSIGLIFSFILTVMLAYFACHGLQTMDWNGLLQRAAAGVVMTFLFFQVALSLLRQTNARFRHSRGIKAVAGFLTLLLLSFLAEQGLTIRNIASADPLFSLAKSTIFTAVVNTDLFYFLQAHTNLPHTTPVVLNEINLPAETKPLADKPFIFIFVIDSLRRDYISAYNPLVTFTPMIGEFAKEATVFTNAFTRYGATGLSEPAIWAGQMFPHLMYPQPFYKINLLQKLIEADDYPVWLSRDSILREILKPSDKFRDLDVGVGTQELDFCQTAGEIASRLKESHNSPVFVYTQPQNIHISVLARGARPGTSTTPHPGFYAPYANALERVDGCFGQFIRTLKELQLFDQSIVVLTSDHGDSLGEEGRFGHAYTIFPEVMRIPLMIHLPSAHTGADAGADANLAAGTVPADRGKAQNVDRVSFSTDLAPTLAALLGRPMSVKSDFEGRDLFGQQSEPLPILNSDAIAESHLVMSSYGPVAGLVSRDGKSIYISDAINFANYFYLMNDKGSSHEEVGPEVKSANDNLIKDQINKLYSRFGL